MAMATPQYRMADRLTGGILAETLIRYRSEGLSFDAIAARLWADHGIEVSGSTVRNWAIQNEAEVPS